MPISFYVKSTNAFLDATLWLPKSIAKAGLIFCHGWGGGSQYDDLLETLADNGYFALRFQQRGYGNSTAQSDLGLWVEDMAACASVLAAVTNKIWAAGQSTGGTMSLIAALARQLHFFRLKAAITHLRSVNRRLVIETILAWLNAQDSHSQ